MKRKRSSSSPPLESSSLSTRRKLDLYEHVHTNDSSVNGAEIKVQNQSMIIELDESLDDLAWDSCSESAPTRRIPPVYANKLVQWREKHEQRLEQASTESNTPLLGELLEQTSTGQHVLLSQKYEPTKFVDLLTNHDANREALKWLKSWDSVVFHNNPHSLPKQKILLLAGPPGVGKTTLAHCLANHCSYTLCEINASDDRSRESLIQHIKARAQSKSVMTPQKPKLVLLDEIDGALHATSTTSNAHQGRSAIAELLALARSTKDPLTRPIICTCNDLYAPALKELRAYAKLVVFRRDMNNDDRVISRIQHICNVEKIPITLNDLHKLTHTYQGDIRSCLNALHFLRLGFSPHFKHHSSPDANSSLKDLDKGYFDLMQFVFNHRANSLHELISFLATEVGDFKLVDGCFSNYLNQPFSDPDFAKVRKTIDYLSFCDLAATSALEHTQYVLNNYILTGLIASHFFCRPNTTKFIKLQLPMDYFQARKKTREHMQLCHQFRERITPELYTFYSGTDLLLHVLSPLYVILNTPQLRKDISDVYLLSQQETKVLGHLLSVHQSLGLTYEFQFVGKKNAASSAASDNQYSLHPNIFQLLLDLDTDLPERGTTYAIPLCQYMNHGGAGEAPSQEGGNTTPSKAATDSPFFAKPKAAQNQSPASHNEGPVKFVFEDSASKAIRHPAKISEWY